MLAVILSLCAFGALCLGWGVYQIGAARSPDVAIIGTAAAVFGALCFVAVALVTLVHVFAGA